MMMQDPGKQLLLPKRTPLPTLVPFGISRGLILGFRDGGFKISALGPEGLNIR